MKHFLFGTLFLVVLLSANKSFAEKYSCHLRLGLAGDEVATDCGQPQEVDITDESLTSILYVKATCRADRKIFVYLQKREGRVRMDFVLQQSVNGEDQPLVRAWNNLSPSATYWMGVNSRDLGFAEIACIRK